MVTMPEPDQLRTGWTGKHEMDGSERYEYRSDFDELTVRIWEDFFDEPDDDFDEDDPQRYAIDKRLSYWSAECCFCGPPELFPLGENYRQEGGSKRESNVAFCYWDRAAPADEALLRLLAGDNSCEWVVWFKAHYRDWTRPPSDFDQAQWLLNHTALLNQ